MKQDTRFLNPWRMPKRWLLQGLGLLIGLTVVGGCKASQPEALAGVASQQSPASTINKETRMWMTVGEQRFAITLADTDAARAFAVRLPLTLDMPDLNGNEKHADLPQPLPANASRPGTIRSGDLMLYGTNTIVIFYETFQSSYSYTRLGRVDDPGQLIQALGPGDSRLSFSKQ